jgi:hypothetical protein
MRYLSACAAVAIVIGSLTFATAEEEKTEKVSVLDAGQLTVPATFKRVEPQSRIVEHEFQAKAEGGDDSATARLTMMAAGGDVAANVQRWKAQFAGGDPDKQKSETMKVGKWEVHLVDVTGSYAERMGGGPFAGGKVVNRSDYAMVGAILVHPEGGKYFLKLIGPEKVVTGNREAFVKMVKSLE